MGELDPIIRGMVARGVAALDRVGADLQGEAQRNAPIEEGTLRGSGRSEVHVRPDGAEVEVSFSTPYAARQHEETTWEHPRGGRAKYLEAPLLARVDRFARIIGAAIGKGL